MKKRTPPSFRPALRRRIHEDISEQLRDAILDGKYRPGDRLPPERELAAQFDANRTSIREAMKVLEGLGLVRIRQGDGATVLAPIDGSLDLLAPMIFHSGRIDGDMLADLTEVLVTLLCEMARLAVERFSKEQLEELRDLRNIVADTALPIEARGAAARETLVVLSDMTENRVWQMLARRTRELLGSPPMQETRKRLRRDPTRTVAIMDACLTEFDAGRPERALAALRRLIVVLGDPAADETPDPSTNRRAHA